MVEDLVELVARVAVFAGDLAVLVVTVVLSS
jgi:hypothetical protein